MIFFKKYNIIIFKFSLHNFQHRTLKPKINHHFYKNIHIMKKSIVFLLSIFVIFFQSCSQDETHYRTISFGDRGTIILTEDCIIVERDSSYIVGGTARQHTIAVKVYWRERKPCVDTSKVNSFQKIDIDTLFQK